MQSSKIRFQNKSKKRWPIIVIIIAGIILIITPTVWLGLHNWNLDESLIALNLDQSDKEPVDADPEPQEKPEQIPDSEDKETAPAEKPGKTETPTETEKPEESKESPTPPVEKPADNTIYIPNQVLPTSPTVKEGIILANKQNPLPSNYNKGEDPKARAAFEEMAAAARLDGFEIVAFSTFRSFERQETLYTQYVAKDGQEAADRYSARPGYSEHQTGLAFDIGEKNFEQHWASSSFGDTPAGKWVAQNAHLYGFILRYPLGKEQVTGYMHESWHFRYVGVEPATDMYTHKQTLEEYLGL